MFIIQSVESGRGQVRLSRRATVGLLVVVAVYAQFWAFERVAEIRREAAFQQQLTRNVDELIKAADAVAAKNHRR